MITPDLQWAQKNEIKIGFSIEAIKGERWQTDLDEECCLPGLIIHQNEPARQRARELVNTPEFAKAQRQRKKVEALFAGLKNQIGLRRLRLRRLKFVREQFFLAAVAQNIKRLVRFLSQPTSPVLPATT